MITALPMTRRRLRSQVWARGSHFPGFAVLPVDEPRAHCIGPDPVRITIVGGGLGAGFGASAHDASLTGRLCVAVHDALGRGVVVTSRARPRMTISDVPASLGGAGAHSLHAIVFTPNISSAIAARRGSWQRAAQAMIDHVRATGGPDLPVVLAGLPPFRFSGPHEQRVELERIASERAMTDFAAAAHRVGFASVSSTPDLDVDTDYSDFYRAFATDVSSVLIPILAPSTRHRSV